MIKERQRDKCRSVHKKGRINHSGFSALTFNNGLLKINPFGNDVTNKKVSFTIGGDIIDRTSCSSSSLACSFTDSKVLVMDICPMDSKLGDNAFVNTNLSACKLLLKTEDLMGVDTDFSSDFILDGASISSFKIRKTEDVMHSDPIFAPDTCDEILSSIPVSVGSADCIVDGVPSLRSNAVNKQPPMDTQYMQQQNQVFVFSTRLANESAESVMKGKSNSIIEYHCNQTDTKKYLMRHPLKINQFNRQSRMPWMNNISQVKQKSVSGINARCGGGRSNFRNNVHMKADIMNRGCEPPQAGSINIPSRLPVWNQPQGNMISLNSSNQHGTMSMPFMCGGSILPRDFVPPSMIPGAMASNQVTMIHSNMLPMKCQPQLPAEMSASDIPNALISNSVLPADPALVGLGDEQYSLSSRPQLTGTKIPDENLTPTERIRREGKLAHLRKIGQLLMPSENQQPPSSQHQHVIISEMPSFSHNPTNVNDISSVLNSDSNSGRNSLGGLNDSRASKKTNAVENNSAHMGPAGWQNMTPFFEERGKRLPDLSNASNCGSRSQGPPPPYHQPTARSASVPIAASSPNPNSPGNATSNLSLPSPRTCSGVNSPVSRQPPGPSPTTNQMNTNIDSPGLHGRGVNISNPGTPVSSSVHLSPNSKQKDSKTCTGSKLNEFSPATSGKHSPDGIYSRSLQSLARQQQQKQQPLQHTKTVTSTNSQCKEPSLMPVPSPQHIQYCNFEGQELIIQKQPNTSLKESSNIISSSLSIAGLDTTIPISTENSCSKVTVSAPNTPLTPPSLDLCSTKYPATPGDFSSHSPGSDGKAQLRNPNNSQMKNDLRFMCNSPEMIEQQQQPQQQQRFSSTSAGIMLHSDKNNFLEKSPAKKMSCSIGDDVKDPVGSCVASGFSRAVVTNNVPIDPTSALKPSFDPISSMAQMSQSLTNNMPGSPGSQVVGMIHSNMVPYNLNSGSGGTDPIGPGNVNMLQMNEMTMCGNPNNDSVVHDNSRMVFISQMRGPPMNSMSMMSNRMLCPDGIDNSGPPKHGNMPPAAHYQPIMGGNKRLLRPQGQPMPGPYNNANVQVKPSAPNTIQYLPNTNRSPQLGMVAPGLPSLDFLRYPNAYAMPSNMEKMQSLPNHDMNYFQGNYAGASSPGGPNTNEHMGNMNCAMPLENAMVRSAGMRGLNPPQLPSNIMRMGLGGGGSNIGMASEQMFNVNMSNNNYHMFMSGVLGSKIQGCMGMGGNMAPDTTQPLSPSMGQTNNFKHLPFMDQPEMNNPHYRMQYQNFQAQLYATNTRGGQMCNQPMTGGNQQYFLPK